jgi:hypothetical protein
LVHARHGAATLSTYQRTHFQVNESPNPEVSFQP